MNWIERSLDELGEVGRGRSRHRPRDAAHLYGGPHPFVQTGDVKSAGLYLTEFTQTYSDAGLGQSKLWKAGTLCITIAANIAETAILGIDACFPDSVIGFVADEKKADSRFIKYMFDARLKHQYRSFSQGVAQDNLSQEKLLSIQFRVPERVSDQKAIADVLATYDALIANNNRRIVLAEQSARLLFEEWFVRLRYPGHEHGKIVDAVPDGWRRKKVKEQLAKLSATKKIRKEDFLAEGDVPCVDQSKEFINGYTNDVEARIEAPLPIIVFGDHTRILKYVDFPFARGADGTQLIYPQMADLSVEYLYFALGAADLSNYFYARHFKFLKELEILVPPPSLVETFSLFAKSNLRQISRLRTLNNRLARARDLLLPRLMDGRIEV